MPIPALSLVPSIDDATEAIAVYGVPKGEQPEVAGFDTEFLRAVGASGKRDWVVRSIANGRRVAFVGLGGDRSPARLREAAGAAVRALRDEPSIALALPVATSGDVRAVLEGGALGAYRYSAAPEKSPLALREIAVVTGEASAPGILVSEARIAVEAAWTVRDLANTPPNLLSPADFAELAVAGAEAAGVTATVRDHERLRREGFGGLVAVGQGSSRPPRLVTIEYAPEGATKHVALVGKGITFDSGGLSLKPAKSMQHMKYDMAGAAVVYAATLAAAALQLPLKVTAHLCLAENLVSSTSTRPDDVITIRGGTTVEVTNTDAEGRLVMADALALASEAEPDAIIDVATLTGAQVVALGDRTAGVMGNDDALIDLVLAASREAGDHAWPMPIPDEMRGLLDSEVADLANAKVGNTAGGMLLAASFLSEFVGDRDGVPIPWAHIDIAGPAVNLKSAYGHTPAGATGAGVRGLTGALAAMARSVE